MIKKWLFYSVLLWLPPAWALDGVITKLVVREMLPGNKVTAGYFTLNNHSDKPLILQSVSADWSPRIEIHRHSMENGLMKMQQVSEAIVIAPHQKQRFEPGGLHLMIFDPAVKVKKGLTLALTFNFSSDSITSDSITSGSITSGSIKNVGKNRAKTVSGQVISVLDEVTRANQHAHHH